MAAVAVAAGWAGWSRRGRRVPQQGWAVGTGLQVDTHSSVIRQGNNTAARLRLVVRGTPLNATLWLLLAKARCPKLVRACMGGHLRGTVTTTGSALLDQRC